MNQHGLLTKTGLLALALAGGPLRAAEPSPASRITGVDSAGAGRLAIHATQKPSFTVSRLTEPSRLVIDLAGADVTGLPKSIPLKTAGLLGISVAQFEEGGHTVGRLVLALAADSRTEVAAKGNDLLVALAAADAPSPSEPPAPSPAPAVAPAAAAPAPAATAPVALDTHLVLERKDDLQVAHAATRVHDLRVQRTAGQSVVRIVTDGEVGSYTLLELREPGRLAVDLHGVSGPARKLAAAGLLSGVRSAMREGSLRVVLDAPTERVAAYEIERRKDGLEVRVGARAVAQLAPQSQKKPEGNVAQPAQAAAPQPGASAEAPPSPRVVEAARPAAVAPVKVEVAAPVRAEVARPAARGPASEPPAPQAQRSEVAKVAVAARLAEVKAVDLRTESGLTEVEIAVDGAYRFEVAHPTATAVVLTLTGVSLPERLERNLDASELGGAVDVLSSYRVPDHPDTVKIVATLRGAAKDEVEATKHGLRWKFGGAPIARSPAPVVARASAMAADARSGGAPAPAAVKDDSPRTEMQKVLEESNYSGRRVDFNVKDIDIRNLLNAIADISKKNVIIADDVKGTVSIRLRNVPWDQALDIILKSKGLAKEEVGNIIRIAPLERLRAEIKEAADAAKVKVDYEPLKVRLIPINYATAPAMVTQIKDSLTPRGTVTVDTRTNTLIVKDVADALLRAEGIIRNLDTQTPEVLIEARIVEASTSFSRSAGIQWGGNVAFGPQTGNPTGLIFPSILQLAGAADDSQASVTGLGGLGGTPNFAVNMPAPIGANNGAGVGMVFGSAGGTANLNLRLSAAENSGTAKTISSPRVVTLDNMAATISQGVSIPFSQASAAGANTAFAEARLQLSVTPHVTQEGSVQMRIAASNDSPNTGVTGSGGQPSISRREASTNVLVRDGDTTVIGGIYTRNNSEGWNEVPILSKIPILGWLFKKKAISDNRTELLIFITPRIVNRAQSIVAEARGADVNQ